MPRGHHFVGYWAARGATVGREWNFGDDQREDQRSFRDTK